ncbi:MAG: hypothetical protein ACOCP8_02965 [archaeon]
MKEFWRDEKMDKIIEDIIDIFNLKGVELVRLSGLTNRERKLSGLQDLSPKNIDNIIKKLKKGGVLNYEFIMVCPRCDEMSYQIKQRDITKLKKCDTCGLDYKLIKDNTLFLNDKTINKDKN